MKTIAVIIILLVITTAVGFFGLPVLMENKISPLKSDVENLKQRLQKIEDESRAAPLKPDADFLTLVKKVNALYYKIESIEDSIKKNMFRTDKIIEEQKTINENALKKLTENLDRINKETKALIQEIKFDAAMANINGHFLKARADLQYKNIGTAKTELDYISKAFEKVKMTASDENKKVIEELQGILKKARTEMDTNLPAAINRIDLLWHEMGKLLRDA
jgi:hypothetical protein